MEQPANDGGDVVRHESEDREWPAGWYVAVALLFAIVGVVMLALVVLAK